jgi:hypothetical protein
MFPSHKPTDTTDTTLGRVTNTFCLHVGKYKSESKTFQVKDAELNEAYILRLRTEVSFEVPIEMNVKHIIF